MYTSDGRNAPQVSRALFENIVANLNGLSVDEIRERLRPLTRGMTVEAPLLLPGTFLYRARKVDGTFNKDAGIRLADLSYPKDRVRLGRLNRDGYPMFYCSAGKESLFFELANLQVSDEIIVSIWQARCEEYLNSIGRRLSLGSGPRECAQYGTGRTASRLKSAFRACRKLKLQNF
jgi:hypothetical protein